MKIYTVKVIASWLDMTERNVRHLVKKKVLTEYRPGLFRLKENVRAYINYLRKQGPEQEEEPDYNKERALMVRTKRETAELELKLRKNELHQSEDIELIMSDMLLRFRTKLMSIPAKQSPILAEKEDQKEVFKILKTAIDEALDELSNYDTAFGDNDEEVEERAD